DVGLLRSSGVLPQNPRKAPVNDFALRIGNRATLLPSPGRRSYGVLMGLTHGELERLYQLGRERLIGRYVHSVSLFPVLSVNAPTMIMMKSMSHRTPKTPPVSNMRIPVPILPT